MMRCDTVQPSTCCSLVFNVRGSYNVIYITFTSLSGENRTVKYEKELIFIFEVPMLVQRDLHAQTQIEEIREGTPSSPSWMSSSDVFCVELRDLSEFSFFPHTDHSSERVQPPPAASWALLPAPRQLGSAPKWTDWKWSLALRKSKFADVPGDEGQTHRHRHHPAFPHPSELSLAPAPAGSTWLLQGCDECPCPAKPWAFKAARW